MKDPSDSGISGATWFNPEKSLCYISLFLENGDAQHPRPMPFSRPFADSGIGYCWGLGVLLVEQIRTQHGQVGPSYPLSSPQNVSCQPLVRDKDGEERGLVLMEHLKLQQFLIALVARLFC
jgi:hypothetical protein